MPARACWFSATRDDPHADWDTWDEVPYFKDSWYGIGIDTWEGPRLPCLGEGFLGFELREGVSDDEFRKLLVLMGECIARITYTGPAQPGWRPGRRASHAITATVDAELARIVESHPFDEGKGP